jgi:glycerophosphoryl diester phosphodiesterase
VLAGRTWPNRNCQNIPLAESIVSWYHRRQLVAQLDYLLDGFDLLVAFHRTLSRSAVARCHELGHQVYAWTVDGTARVEWLRSIGVDGVISDQPASLGFDVLGNPNPAPGVQGT